MSEIFTILPSTGSIIMEMFIVLFLIIIYIICICYVSAYNTGYKPNYVMFINFLFDDYSGTKNFQTYINNIIVDNKSKEKFTLLNKSSNVFSDFFHRIVSTMYIKGNKLTIRNKFRDK